MYQPKWGLNGFTLKCIAIITMLIDHVGMALFPWEVTFRIIGRLAFPIFCFLLVEGAVHTRNSRNYLLRLVLFAFLSEIPFDLVCSGKLFDWDSQNVFFTLSLGLVAICCCKWGIEQFQAKRNQLGNPKWMRWLAPVVILGAFAMVLVAEFLRTDYGGGGILIILIFYLYRQQQLPLFSGFSVVTVLVYGGIQTYSIFSLAPILCYNGKRGPGMKYFFYLFYPAHLLILYWLKYHM